VMTREQFRVVMELLNQERIMVEQNMRVFEFRPVSDGAMEAAALKREAVAEAMRILEREVGGA